MNISKRKKKKGSFLLPMSQEEEELKNLAIYYKGTWVGVYKSPTRNKTMVYKWRCSKQHLLIRTIRQISQRKGWSCGKCKHIEKIQWEAIQKGLTVEKENVKWKWKCPQGHSWETCYSRAIYGYSGCPRCKKSFRTHSPPKTKDVAVV